MPNPFGELRERLLRAGVAPRHVRRYLRELADHLSDLIAEEQRAGHGRAEAEALAFARLGSMDHLAAAMIGKPQFCSWAVRLPWAAFGLLPLFVAAAAYFLACAYLWCGWTIFLPGADTPFGRAVGGPVYGLQNTYFQTGKFFYMCIPLLVGWGTALVAVRQRIKAAWPALGLALIAWMGATARIQASRTEVPRGLGHITMGFFAPKPTAEGVAFTLLSALVLFSLMALPVLLWRLRMTRPRVNA